MKKNIERMRYQNDSVSFWLCILSIILNIVYFVGVYRNKDVIPDYTVGIDVIVNILFMLIVFLGSEKAKAYAKGWPGALAVIGLIQLLRTQFIPKRFLASGMMAADKHLIAVVFLALSGAALLAAAVVSQLNGSRLRAHLAEQAKNELSEEDRAWQD